MPDRLRIIAKKNKELLQIMVIKSNGNEKQTIGLILKLVTGKTEYLNLKRIKCHMDKENYIKRSSIIFTHYQITYF